MVVRLWLRFWEESPLHSSTSVYSGVHTLLGGLVVGGGEYPRTEVCQEKCLHGAWGPPRCEKTSMRP